MKSLKVHFFKIEDNSDIKAALQNVWQMESDEARNYPFNDGPVRLREFSAEDGLLLGDMMRIRLDEPAMVAKLGGGERSVAKDDDEGLGETNAFLYCPEKKCLAYQRNRGGVSVDRFFYYLQQKTSRETAIDYKPMIKSTTVDDLIGASTARKLEIKVKPISIRGSTDGPDALADVIHAANLMECAQFKVEFSMGRERRGGINKSAAVKIIRWLLRLREQGHDVGTLQAVCKHEGGKSEVLDFIDALLLSEQRVEPSKLHNEFYKRRIACVRAAWEECSRQIE